MTIKISVKCVEMERSISVQLGVMMEELFQVMVVTQTARLKNIGFAQESLQFAQNVEMEFLTQKTKSVTMTIMNQETDALKLARLSKTGYVQIKMESLRSVPNVEMVFKNLMKSVTT